MREEIGDLLDYARRGYVIFHQANSLGVWGAGLAKQLAKAFPDVKHDFDLWLRDIKKILPSPMGIACLYGWRPYHTDLVKVVSLVAQDTIGRTGKHTSYAHLGHALVAARRVIPYTCHVAFPHGMGCGLGGGDWMVVRQMIEEVFPDAVIVCKNAS